SGCASLLRPHQCDASSIPTSGRDGGILGKRGLGFHHGPLPSIERRPCNGVNTASTRAPSEIGRRVILPMQTIDLTYVGRGIHEELIAYVADQEGYFEDEGVHVALRDGTRWETERLRAGATIGLGRALLSRLTDGIQWNVLTVNTHRPLFW